MLDIVRIAEWEGYAVTFGLCAIVLLQILNGRIRIDGLIEGQTRRGTKFVSAARVQLLIVTLAVAVHYIALFRQNPTVLPDIPKSWVVLFGGSHVVYLGNKFRGKRSRSFHV